MQPSFLLHRLLLAYFFTLQSCVPHTSKSLGKLNCLFHSKIAVCAFCILILYNNFHWYFGCRTKKMAPLPPPPNVRRSNRASLPNTILMYRREIIRENFCKTAVQTTKKKLNDKFTAIKSKLSAKVQNKNKSKSNTPKQQKKRDTDGPTKQTKQLNGMVGANTLPPSTLDDELTDGKMDTTDKMGIPKSFGNFFR